MKLWFPSKIRLIVVFAFTFSFYILFFYFDYKIHDILPFRRIIVEEIRATDATKKVLFWNTLFGDETFYMGKGDIFFQCPVNDCYATHDRKYADLSDFDAVLFHGNELKLSDLPKKRSQGQWYVFVNLESPVNRPLTNHFYEDFFNLTMTYRLDSDLMWTYGVFKDARTDQIVAPTRNTSWNSFHDRTGERTVEDASLLKTIRGKTRPIVWFVSNCQAKSGRWEYVNELSQLIPVDIYGSCGSKRCPLSEDCFAKVAEPEYFFYLSFENSLCNDYVTEKLYNALRYNIVPIVYGGANYSLFAPPGSYINVLDFDSPKDLAVYLKELMRNPQKYSEYFAWKRYYKIDSGTQSAVCNLCEFLHRNKQPKLYDSLSNWYSKSKCPLQNYLNYYSFLTGSMLRTKTDLI